MKFANFNLYNFTEYNPAEMLVLTAAAMKHGQILRYSPRARQFEVRVEYSRGKDTLSRGAKGQADQGGPLAIIQMPRPRFFSRDRSVRDPRFERTMLDYTCSCPREAFAAVMGHEVQHLRGLGGTREQEYVAELSAGSFLNHVREYWENYDETIREVSGWLKVDSEFNITLSIKKLLKAL